MTHICYLSYNTSEDIGYVGYESGNGDSRYYGSSDYHPFLSAKRNGKLTKYILGRFESELEARTAEVFSIKKLREGGMNLYNRNVGGGGKDGSVNDFRILNENYIKIVDNVSSNRKFPEIRIETNIKTLVNNILERIVTGNIEKIEERLDVLSQYDYHQVRVVRIIRSHVTDLKDLMEENPVLFRAKTDPIIVVVDDRDPNNIEYILIGGNHRRTAAGEVGWDTFPTVYVNFSELEYNGYGLTLLGEHDNIMGRKIEKSMDSEDVKRMLEEFHKEYPQYHPTSVLFRDIFASMRCGGNLSETRLKKAATNWGKAYNEKQIAKTYNFHQYDTSELEELRNSLRTNFRDAVVVSDTASSIMNNGIGGILNSFGMENYRARLLKGNPKKHGIIMARFAKTSEISDRDSYIEDFDNAMSIAGFSTEDNQAWVNNAGYKVSLIFLPYVHESDNPPVTWKNYQEQLNILKENSLNFEQAA